MNSIFERVSVREFQDRDVEEEKLHMLLRAAMAAPSACNQQPWEFYVVKNKRMIEKLSACSPYAGCLKNAPVAIVSCYRTQELTAPDYAQIDLSIATEHILLEAVEQGLGTVWLGIAPLEERMEDVKRTLNVREDLQPFAIVACGYPVHSREQQNRFDQSRIHILE